MLIAFLHSKPQYSLGFPTLFALSRWPWLIRRRGYVDSFPSLETSIFLRFSYTFWPEPVAVADPPAVVC